MFALFFACGVMASCGPTTHIVDSWRDPDVTVDTANVHKFVIAALLKNESVRRKVEDDMAALFPGKAVPSYQEFGDSLKEPDDALNARLKKEGFDGVVVMRLVNVNRSTRYVPGSYPLYYGSWRRYWAYSWGGFYDPGYYTTDRQYNVEVTVFSLRRDKLIWTANTSTIDPPNRAELFDHVSRVVLKRMKKEGFLR